MPEETISMIALSGDTVYDKRPLAIFGIHYTENEKRLEFLDKKI